MKPTPLQRIAYVAFFPIIGWYVFCDFIFEHIDDGTKRGLFWALLLCALFTLAYIAIIAELVIVGAGWIVGRML